MIRLEYPYATLGRYRPGDLGRDELERYREYCDDIVIERRGERNIAILIFNNEYRYGLFLGYLRQRGEKRDFTVV